MSIPFITFRFVTSRSPFFRFALAAGLGLALGLPGAGGGAVRADQGAEGSLARSKGVSRERADEDSPPLPDADSPDEAGEWIELFDGESLEGWVQRGGRASFEATGGEIVGTSRPYTPNSFLCTEATYRDFILELEFKVDPRLNSGVQIRSELRRENQRERVVGYQVEIDPSDRAWSGGIYDEGRRGWLFKLDHRPAAQAAFRSEQWNHFRIECRGPNIRTWINGVAAADLKDDMTREGFIGLQVHRVRSEEPLQVRWRNLRLQPLD